jgi:hypothetical protein
MRKKKGSGKIRQGRNRKIGKRKRRRRIKNNEEIQGGTGERNM